MKSQAWQLSYGANLVGPQQTLFRLWAPAQREVSVAIAGRPPLPMRPSSRGWFELEADCGAGARYHYQLDDGMLVPDPVSRAQSGDVHGSSVVVDPNAYQWRNEHWRGRPWPETVFYELHVGILGGFAGVERDLPRLAELGVTAIELMPIAEFPGTRNWGYDGVLPFAPESSYGTPNDLKVLIDAVHDHGMMIFLDVVYNHFGPDGNYIASYAPGMFRGDVNTPWGPAIDFRPAEVRRFFIDNALYWLIEYRFDGLRLDAVHAIGDPTWLYELAAEVRRQTSDREVHLVLENDDNTATLLAGAFDAQWNDDGHHVLHRLLTGEKQGYYQDYAETPAALLARALKEGFVYQGAPSRYRGGKSRGTPSADLPPTAFVLFLQNHDQVGNRAFGERLTRLADPAALEAAIALVLLCPQIPLMFMGEETGSKSPFLFFTDHKDELANAVREGRRHEFASFPQFNDMTLLEEIPDPNDIAAFVQSIPVNDEDCGSRRQQLYRTLLAIRRTEIMPRLAGSRAIDASAIGAEAVMASWRMNDGAKLAIYCNLGKDEIAVPLLRDALLFASSSTTRQSMQRGRLPAVSTVAVLTQ
jgi:maltooligosyltrehalose trehalohydrolase